MKTKITFLLVTLLFISNHCYCDIILENTHYFSKCVKITNVEDYPDICLIGFVNVVISEPTYVISSANCLTKGYRRNVLNILAVNKSYFSGKNISKNWLIDSCTLPSNIKIEPDGGYINDSIPISAIEEYYKIVGFTDSNVILYKWKQVTKYNNGKPDLIENFNYSGDVSSLSQKITVGINVPEKQPNIEVYPNPTNKNIHLRIEDSYKGTLAVELITSTGKVLKSFNLSKSELILNYDIPVAKVAKGAYIIKVQMGKAVESKKILIK